jgi:LmbE family N-acetylglucosaminyl deacetylase
MSTAIHLGALASWTLKLVSIGMMAFLAARPAFGQDAPRRLLLVVAHADDEAPVAPMLARYAREGVQVTMIIATDGGAGTGAGGMIAREGRAPAEGDLAQMRAQEARCAAGALGIEPPILLGFPDGKLGDYVGDRSLVYRLTQRFAAEIERLRPEVVITWGPDGGTGHPDHRIVSTIVTQLQRAGAPGMPERVFHMYLTVEGMNAMNPQRGAPPFVMPRPHYFTTRVPFTPADLDSARRSMGCHRTQFSAEVIERVFPATARAWNGTIGVVPAFMAARGTDLFE